MSDKTDMISHADAIAANPIDTAPKDGTMLRLLVDYTDEGANPLDDEDQAWTIGFNQLSDTEEDVWEFAGWSWEQDCFTAGYGRVIGWLPFHALPAAQVADPDQIREAALREAAAVVDEQYARGGMGNPGHHILALIDTPPAVPDYVAAQKRQQSAQTLWDLLHMKNGAHDGMTSGDVQALWDDVKEEAGYAAVTAFLAKLKGGTS